jgi:serine/threonine protein kinase/tetratricopeptide (TPR) repeat protein
MPKAQDDDTLRGAQDDDLVMNLVELALSQPPDTRETYLRTACGTDGELFTEVWDHVQWNHRMQDFLLEPLYPVLHEHVFEPGDVLVDRFRIVGEVGQGGMGVVYEAEDQRLGSRIALKCAKSGFRKRLPPEVRHAREISHPHVCKIFEIHTASIAGGDIDFLTMEFLEGETLAARLSRGTPPKAEARAIGRQICAGLAEAHRNRVVHGDLKSNNVILTRDAGGDVRAVITDFGLARKPLGPAEDATGGRAASLAGSSQAGGVPDYMAPELWKGEKPSAASDVYALGVVLYELAANHRPYPQETPWQDRLKRKPPAVHHEWDSILQRCLDPDPLKRFRDAGEVAAALEPALWRRWWMGAAAAVVLAAAASGVVTYQRTTAPKESIRLAVLPFESDAESAALTEGLLLDTSDRLSHVRAGNTRKLTLIPPAAARQNKVDQPAKARTMLGATHALHGMLRKQDGRILVSAYLTDTSSLVHLKEWRGEYSMDALRNMPVALAGMVTGTLKLPALAIRPTVSPAAYADYSAAGSLLARGDRELDRAIGLLEHAVAADPNSPLTHARLAEAQWRKAASARLCGECVAPLDSQSAERALASLKDAEQRNPDVAAVRTVSGRIHEYFGQYEEARADLERAIELDPPGDSESWRRLARVYEGNDQMNEALGAYRKALDLQPDYFRNYQGLGNFYFLQEDYNGAIRAYKEMARLAPDLAEAHYALATPYLNMGRYADAEYELRLALGFQETAIVLEGLGLVRMYQDRDSEAISYFERANTIGPPQSLYYLNLGTSLRRAGFSRESEQAYRTGRELAVAELERNPRNVFGRACLAYLCARLGDRGRAESEIAQALRFSSHQILVRWMAALTYEALGQHDRTLSVIEDVPATTLDRLNRFPDLAELHVNPRFQELLHSHPIQ